MEFSDLDKYKVKFLRLLLKNILTKYDERVVQEVFQNIMQYPKLATLREGLKLFISHFLLHGKDNIDTLLAERIKMTEKILNSEEIITRF